MYKYKIRYNFGIEYKEEGFTKDDAGDNGLADAIIYCSILTPPDGSLSHHWGSSDGKGNLPSSDIFKAFSTLAYKLSTDENLHEWQRYICKEAFDKVRQVITRNND